MLPGEPLDVEQLKAEMAQVPAQLMSSDTQFAISTPGNHGFAPEGGFAPEAFPQITIDPIPYTTNPLIRPDPRMHVTDEGWLYIEVGTIRIAIPDREEWDKLVHMVEAMFNTHDYKCFVLAAQAEQEKTPDD